MLKGACLPVPTPITPDLLGWTSKDGAYSVVWFEGQTLPQSIQDLICDSPDTVEKEDVQGLHGYGSDSDVSVRDEEVETTA